MSDLVPTQETIDRLRQTFDQELIAAATDRESDARMIRTVEYFRNASSVV